MVREISGSDGIKTGGKTHPCQLLAAGRSGLHRFGHFEENASEGEDKINWKICEGCTATAARRLLLAFFMVHWCWFRKQVVFPPKC